jgi:hypothetical protein
LLIAKRKCRFENQFKGGFEMTLKSEYRQAGKISMVVLILLLMLLHHTANSGKVEAFTTQQNIEFYHCIKSTPMQKGDFVPILTSTTGLGNTRYQTLDGTYISINDLMPVLYTTTSNVPVRPSPSQSSGVRGNLKTIGTPVKMIGSIRNSSNNLWYEIEYSKDLKGYIFSGNLSSTGNPLTFSYTPLRPALYYTVKGSVPLWQAPYSSSRRIATLGNANYMVINGRLTNSFNNNWFRTTEGAWIFSGNIKLQELNDANILVKQSVSGRCTLASAATILRRNSILNLDPQWHSITEKTLQRDAWVEDGLKGDFTHRGVRLQRHNFDGDLQSRKQQLLQLLDRHPEGIVIFGRYDNGELPHAVVLVGYNTTKDQFTVLDPSRSRTANTPMLLTEAVFPGRSQDERLNNIRFIWAITK